MILTMMSHTKVILEGPSIRYLCLQKAGMKVGDFLVGVGDKDVKWYKHDEVVSLVRMGGSHLTLKLITPIDRNFLQPQVSSGSSTGSPVTPNANGEMRSRKSTDKGSKGKGLSWTLRRRRSASKEKKSKIANGNASVSKD